MQHEKIHTIEADHYPDKFDGGRTSKRLELLGVKEDLADASTRRELFSSLEDIDFQKYLGYINAIGQNIPVQYKYQTGELGALLETPSAEDKSALMERAYEAIRTILSDDSFTDNEALHRAGLTMAGAINYIHPYNNGNGRTGRLMHYLITYGTEREADIDNEIYAIVAKQPVYDTDQAIALYDTPPPELTRSLDAAVKKEEAEEDFSRTEIATRRVLRFLDMMTGTHPLATQSPATHNTANPVSQKRQTTEIPTGTDGYTLYRLTFTDHSAITQRSPTEVPTGSQRIKAQRQEGGSTELLVDEI